MITQAVALSSLVSMLYTRKAWDHDPPFGDQEQLVSKAEAQIKISCYIYLHVHVQQKQISKLGSVLIHNLPVV